jgi:hypothetical protein
MEGGINLFAELNVQTGAKFILTYLAPENKSNRLTSVVLLDQIYPKIA